MKSVQEFLYEISEYWGKKRTPAQERMESEELSRMYGDDQWDSLFRAVIRSGGKFMPKLSEIIEIAGENHVERRDIIHNRHYSWQASDCPMCGGEGRLVVIFRTEYELNETERKIHRVFSRLAPYSVDQPQLEDFESSWIFRCSCVAGDNPNLPLRWPRWDSLRHKKITVQKDHTRDQEKGGGFKKVDISKPNDRF